MDRKRLPPWLRNVSITHSGGHATRRLLREHGLHTVCEEARCPNQGECFSRQTATFMILGDTCTRGCAFCAVTSGQPRPPDPAEPEAIAGAVRQLGLRYTVITSVTRDDLPDGGAAHFAAVIRAVRTNNPEVRIEVLVPDFAGNAAAVQTVLAARPDVFNHNVETVPRLYPQVRPQADYRRSLEVLRLAAAGGGARPGGLPVKSGIMAGLGETGEEVAAVMDNLLAAGCQIMTIGQYLQPSRANLPVVRYLEPAEFREWEEMGRAKGFREVFAGPLVRSSYSAGEVFSRLAAPLSRPEQSG